MMPTTRRRWIVRRAVTLLAGVVLLLTSYVSSYGLLFWAIGAQRISAQHVYNLQRTLFRPIMWYGDHQDWPFAESLLSFQYYCHQSGSRATNTDLNAEWP